MRPSMEDRRRRLDFSALQVPHVSPRCFIACRNLMTLLREAFDPQPPVLSITAARGPAEKRAAPRSGSTCT